MLKDKGVEISFINEEDCTALDSFIITKQDEQGATPRIPIISLGNKSFKKFVVLVDLEINLCSSKSRHSTEI